MAAAAGAARLSSSSHLMDEGVGSRSSRSGRRLPPEFGRVLEFVNEILQSDLAVLMILKFMLLCGYKNMAVNNIYAFQSKEKLEPQRVHGAIAVTAGGAWAAETSGSVQPSRRRPTTLEFRAKQANIFAALDRLYIRGGGHGLRCRVHDEALEGVYVVISLSSSTFGAHMEFSRRLTPKKTMATGGLYEQGLPGPASSTNSQLQTITQVSSPSVTNPFYNCSPFPGIPEAEYRCRVYANNKIYATTLFSTSMVSSFRDSKSDDKRFYIFSPTKALKLKTHSKDDRVSGRGLGLGQECLFAQVA
ncbi:hypothetical protein TRIUR3_06391 [Triticum urartu]|uniref:Uncharacterized protein n=1 Tax=Triticum urartu TaxID=4572 RepID=M7ZK58_TRIUA|nr:hypothetical protein TRIUR3_06391 [Triticum urartu]